ncbi:MAG: hypothetical protein SGI88_00665 [Candidatus Hydrogenedentes bacterium]|nr:hypothetical protein [Candidatus Hydrogenedentota bacterium]
MSLTNKVRLEGLVRVSYKQEDGKFYARALEFDLLGIGASREEAKDQLEEVFKLYVEEFLAAPGEMRFFFPAEAEEWLNNDIEYNEVLIDSEIAVGSPSMPARITPAELSRVSRGIRGMELLPA